MIAAIEASQPYCRSAVIYFDDFSDGSVTDNSPFNWTASTEFGATEFEVVDGSLIGRPLGDLVLLFPGLSGADFASLSIRAQVRVFTEQNYIVQVAAGNDETITRSGGGIYGGPYYDSMLMSNLAFADLVESGAVTDGDRDVPTQLDPRNEDLVFQMDLADGSIVFWAWPAGESKPEEPSASFSGKVIPHPKIGVAFGMTEGVPPLPSSTFAVRYFAVSESPLLGDTLNEAIGDFNADGRVDAADYTVWRDGWDSEYTADAYLSWRDNYGATVGGQSADVESTVPVPEPYALVLALVAVNFRRARSRRNASS